MSKRIEEAIDVVYEIYKELSFEENTNVRAARIKATEKVAEKYDIKTQTVHDKISRQFEMNAHQLDSFLEKNLYVNKQEVKKLLLSKLIDEDDAVRIESLFLDPNFLLDDILADEFDYDKEDKKFIEGKWKYYLHRKMERNKNLVNSAKIKWANESNGNIKCSICGFSFKDKYGELGEQFIEAHHNTVPVKEIKKEIELTIADLEPVCSNCHRMLHRMKPEPSIVKLRLLLKVNKIEK